VEEGRQLGSDGSKKSGRCCRPRNIGHAARQPFLPCISKDVLELGKVQTRAVMLSKYIENPVDEKSSQKQECGE